MTIHDMTKLGWGRNIYINAVRDQGAELDVSLIMTPMPDVGDYLILQHRDGDTTRYAVKTLERAGNPRDYAKAVLAFAPREEKDI